MDANAIRAYAQTMQEQRWSCGATVITGVEGLRLGELGRDIGRLLGQSQKQLGNDCHGMVVAGGCYGSSGVAPGLACSSLHPESCPITARHLLDEQQRDGGMPSAMPMG